mgnify:CR=1 FL=1
MVEFLSFREDDATQEPTVTVEAFTGQSNSTAVRIEAGEDARELLPHLDRLSLVEVNFPAFGDGRGYSAARILREAGYAGELRAVGDVLVDQIVATLADHLVIHHREELVFRYAGLDRLAHGGDQWR